MCGTLKYENTSKKIGDLVECSSILDFWDQYPWLGHARDDKPQPLNSELVILKARTYTEKDVEFSVPSDKSILAYLVRSPNFPTGRGVFIITRNATPEELRVCRYSRHPKFG